MQPTRKLKEYWIMISVQVDAHDVEEASAMAKDFLAHGTEGSVFKIAAEVAQIEEA